MRHIIEYGDYMPHGMCLLWQPWLVVLWAGADLLIFLSYMAIPFALISVLRKRDDVPARGLVLLFASFILLCGFTHLAGIVTLWWPIYPWIGALKLATGIVSMITAIVLFRLVPALIDFPSPAQLATANDNLRDEVNAHQATLASLELQVEERTARLQQANEMLAVQAREATHRSGNLLAVVSSLAQQTAKGTKRTEDFLPAFQGRLSALAGATKAILDRDEQSSTALDRVVEAGLDPLQEAYGDRVAFAGPPLAINTEAAQQISLALHELATNTQKYGLGASETAHVEVSWIVTDDRFELVWREYGGPQDLPNDARREGFGTKLLTRVVPAMLRGEADRRFEQNGLIYRLTAPLEAITAPDDGADSDRLAARIVDEKFGLD